MCHKVLIVGKRRGVLHWFEHLGDADRYLDGVQVKGFALNHNSTGERVYKRLLGVLGNERKKQHTLRKLAQTVREYQPDLILVVDLFYFDEQMLAFFSELKGKIALAHWIGDFFDERLERAREIFDLFLFTDTELLQRAREQGFPRAEYLPLATNPRIFYPAEAIQKRDERLLFLGAWSDNREALIRQIEEPMVIVGKGWDKLSKTGHTVVSRNVSIEQAAEYYRQHSYVLNIINTKNISVGLNMRCFEAPASGAVLITDNVRDLPLNYQAGTDVLTYDSAADINTLLRSLRKGGQDASAVEKSGMEKAQADHTYAHRVRTVLEYLRFS